MLEQVDFLRTKNLIKVCTADLIWNVPCRISLGVAKKFQPIISLGKQKKLLVVFYKCSEKKITGVNKLVRENIMIASFPPNNSLFKFRGSTGMASHT